MNRKQMVGGLLGAAVSLFGCTAKPEEPQIVERTEIDGERILIAYYSWGGNTRAAAEALQTLTAGTLLELRPVTPYPDSYLKCVAQAKGECRSGACPPLEPLAVDPAAYDVIFVGTPNWWGTLAPPVRTFLTQAELSGKTVIPFVTHGGGGVQECETAIQALCTDARVLKAGVFKGKAVKRAPDAVKAWFNAAFTLRKAQQADS